MGLPPPQENNPPLGFGRNFPAAAAEKWMGLPPPQEKNQDFLRIREKFPPAAAAEKWMGLPPPQGQNQDFLRIREKFSCGGGRAAGYFVAAVKKNPIPLY